MAYGDAGISYKFSGLTVNTLPWTDLLKCIRDKLYELTGHRFDFVLINRLVFVQLTRLLRVIFDVACMYDLITYVE